MNDEIILGSGKLYLMEYTGTIPNDEEIELSANSVGDIKGGASLQYSPEIYSIENDFGEVRKRVITKETVTFKSGLMTWKLSNLNKLSPAILTQDAIKKEQVLKIGGVKVLKNYVLRFVHTKDSGFKLRISLVATSENGFELKFNSNTETVIDAEFKALNASDGTLVEIRDQQESLPFEIVSTDTSDGKLILVMSDSVQSPVLFDGFSLKSFDNPNVIKSATVSENDPNVIIITPTSSVDKTMDTITLAYTKPLDPAKQVKSVTGVALETFAAINVGLGA